MERTLEELENEVKSCCKEILAQTRIPDNPISKAAAALELANKGVYASRSGDVVRAIACFEAAIELNHRCRNAHYNMAWEWIRLGEELHKPYMGKITVEDGNKFYSKLASRVEFYKKGIANLQRAIEIDPTHAKSWYLLGKTYYYMVEIELARTAFQKTIEIDGDGPDGRLAREGLSIMESTYQG